MIKLHTIVMKYDRKEFLNHNCYEIWSERVFKQQLYWNMIRNSLQIARPKWTQTYLLASREAYMPLYINLSRSERTSQKTHWHSLKERFTLYISLTTINFDIFLHILIDIKFTGTLGCLAWQDISSGSSAGTSNQY